MKEKGPSSSLILDGFLRLKRAAGGMEKSGVERGRTIFDGRSPRIFSTKYLKDYHGEPCLNLRGELYIATY
jgi:hypothetical protein